MKISFAAHKFLLLLIAIFCVQVGYSTTYTVTSTSVGPSTTSGTFLWAVDQANTNPGVDTIEFTPGLQVDASVPSVGPSTSIMAHITESVVIDGKGGALNGIQTWINVSGTLNPLASCPGDVPNTIQFSYMPGFVKIGSSGADNTGIDVSIKNLTIKQFNQVAEIYKNASLVLENFEAYDTWSTYQCAENVMINAAEGVSLTITDSKFSGAENWSLADAAASIYGFEAGDLTIENSQFADLCKRDQPAIYWDGASDSKVNIVSSNIVRSGGIRVLGESVSNIVNSIWVNYYLQVPDIGDRIINSSSGDMNIIASSFVWNTNECDIGCVANLYQNLFEIKGAGNINFSESAVGFNSDPETGAVELNTLGINGGSGAFTADVYTWIQPTLQQDAAALKTMTSQPSLLTDLFGFNRNVFGVTGNWDVEMATPAFPGELIDVIPAGNPLINPIDGITEITLDVVGNPRADANGDRDIGALQLGLAPFLGVSGSGDAYVDLSWNEPLHHDGLSIIKYEVVYDETGGSSPTTVTIDPPVLSKTISGLTNGTEYEFQVRAVYTGPVNGPYSNTVTATPLGPIGTPVVTAVPGNAEVALSWTMPDLGGHTFYIFSVQWSINGNVVSQVITDPATLSTTATGLTAGTEYEFSVQVYSFDGNGAPGLATATPYGPIAAPVVTAMPGDKEVDLSWNLPDLNGNAFNAYVIQWALISEPDVTIGSQVITDYNTLSTTITGLANGTDYVFFVTVSATPFGLSSPGSATATPLAPIVAGADAVDRYPSQSVKVSVATLLSNDVNPETGTNAGLSITAVNNPGASPAIVTLSGGTVFYDPNGHLTADTFEYTVQNSLGQTATGTVTVSLIVDNEPSQNVISFQLLGDGSAETVFGGIPGRTYRIQTTEDLINWTDRDTVVADGVGRVMFTDPPPLVPSRFYRTVSP